MHSLSDGLESLPERVISNISEFIATSSRPYHSAILFAKGSKERRQAVIEALEYRLIFRERERAIFLDLISLFGDTVREISFLDVVDDFFLMRMPYLPHLQSASIIARDKQLLFIKGNPNLTSLEVKINDINDLLLLPAVFDSLKSLTNLTLHLPEFVYPDHDIQEILALTCPDVIKLELRGHNACHRYFNMVKNLRSLQVLSYSGSLGMDSNLHLLPELEEIHLLDEKTTWFAESVGPALRTLFMSRVQNASGLSKLQRCPNLKTLLVAVDEEAEKALIGNTENLESLDIRWGYPFCMSEQVVDEDIYYEPDGESLLGLVRGSPKLRHLLLERALVPTNLIENIFKLIGDRLVQFGVHMTGQDEDVATRLESVLKYLVQYCPNIKCLLLMGMDKEIRATHEQIHRCCLALTKARIMCPKLDIDKIRSHINNIIPLPWKRSRYRNLRGIQLPAILD